RHLRGGEGGEEDLGEPGNAQVRRREQRAGQLRALRQPPPPRGLARMADADAAMALALADGRALLTIENRDLGTAIGENVTVDWPDVSVLPETGRPNGLRKRRGRLRTA